MRRRALRRRYGRARAFTPSAKDPRAMTAGEINRELERLSKERSKVTDEMIAAGHGHELNSETRKLSDPLAARSNAIGDREYDLRMEKEARMGPGNHLLMDMPREFGPRKRD